MFLSRFVGNTQFVLISKSMKIFEAQKGIDSIGRIMPLRDISLKNISLSFVKIVILSFFSFQT